ncbi:MAG: hypothetical protein SF052_23060 [Bacteroidia bacterium]|nr:hypothetical protein [Bacteroidia bacterium]
MKRSIWAILILVNAFFASGCFVKEENPLSVSDSTAKPILQGERAGEGIKLTWGWVKFDLPEYQQAEPQTFYVLYSDNNPQPDQIIATLDASENTFLTGPLEAGKTYYFAIRAASEMTTPSQSHPIMIQPGSNPDISPVFENNHTPRSWGSWSPDGNALAYQATVPGPANQNETVQGIYTYNLTQRTETLRSLGKAPDWSSSVNKITFYGPSALTGASIEGPSHIHIYDLNTESIQSVTEGDSSDMLPAWSNDGQWIAFLSNRLGTDFYQIWKIPLGVNTIYIPSKVFNSQIQGELFAEIEDQYPGRPVWGPLADELTYSRPDGYSRHIFRISAAGGSETPLVSSLWNDYSPAYSPDGETLAFISDRTGGPAIWLLNLASGQLHQLTDLNHIRPEPYALDWSPDGEKILFSAKDGEGVTGLYVLKTH